MHGGGGLGRLSGHRMGASLTVLLRLPFYYLQQLLVVQARFLRVNALAGSADAKRVRVGCIGVI